MRYEAKLKNKKLKMEKIPSVYGVVCITGTRLKLLICFVVHNVPFSLELSIIYIYWETLLRSKLKIIGISLFTFILVVQLLLQKAQHEKMGRKYPAAINK